MTKRQSRRHRTKRSTRRVPSPILQRIRARDVLPSDHDHIRADLKRIAFLGSALIIALIFLSFLLN